MKIVLWTFLFVIPGIVKTYEYRMVPYILADQPDISARDAFAISREMIKGQKVDAWIFECILSWMVVLLLRTLGIFWTGPYVHATMRELFSPFRRIGTRKQNMGQSIEHGGDILSI